MDKLIVLILSIVMVFGGWQIGGQPNETVARDLASKANTSSAIVTASLGEEDVLTYGNLVNYYNKGVTVTVTGTGAGTYSTTGTNISTAGFTTKSIFRLTATAKNADGAITQITVARITIN